MLFLDMNYFKDSIRDLPPAKSLQIRNETWTFVDKHLKDGSLREIYWFADGNGSFSVWEFSTAEEMYRTITASPAHAYFDTEVIPLVTYQDLDKLRKERATAQEAAKK
jgi:hypothetical protein